jgi:hypothetical protein
MAWRDRNRGRSLLAILLVAACAEAAPSALPDASPWSDPSEPPAPAWVEVHPAPPADAGPGVSLLAATGFGYVAAGQEQRVKAGALTTHLRLWRSSDGQEWGAVPDHADFSGVKAEGIVPLDRGALLWGELETPAGRVPRLFESEDGVRWVPADMIRVPAVFENVVGAAVLNGTPLVLFSGHTVWEMPVEPWLTVRSGDGRWKSGEVSGLLSRREDLDVTPTGLIAGGPGLIAYGSRQHMAPGGEVTTVPGFWTSEDGHTWTVARTSDWVPGRVTSVVVTGRGLVATGAVQRPGQEDTPAAWTSSDGLRWQRVEPAPGEPAPAFARAIGGQPGVLAASVADGATEGIWHSVDGTTWCRTDDRAPESMVSAPPGVLAVVEGAILLGPWPQACLPPLPPPPPPEPVAWAPIRRLTGFQAYAAVQTPDGTIVAVGCRDRPDPDGHAVCPTAAIMTTRDGRSWTEVPLDPARDGLLWTVAASDAGMLAVGHRRVLNPAGPDDVDGLVYRSDDGTSWTPMDAGFLAGRRAVSVARHGGEWILGTNLAELVQPLGFEVWTSPDGATWTRSASPEGGTINGMAASGRLFAWGNTCLDACPVPEAITWTADEARSWRRDPDLIHDAGLSSAAATDEGGFIGVGYAAGGLAAWTSPDGETWSIDPLPGAANVHRGILARSGDSWIALGEDIFTGGALAWRSADLRTWAPVSTAGLTSHPENQGMGVQPRFLAVVEGRLLLLALESGSGTLVWEGPWVGN